MALRDRLLNAVKESVESTYDMINTNSVNPDEMGMATSAPGEFSAEEITDKQNLVNQGSMSNDNDYDKDDCDCEIIAATVEIDGEENKAKDDLLNISEPVEEIPEEDNVLEMRKKINGFKFGESRFSKIVQKALNESEYGAPLSYVPDTRINASDVLRELKAQLKDDEDKAKVSINKNVDAEDNKTTVYTVNQVEHSKLPKSITVENVDLVLDDKLNNYIVKDVKKTYPVKQDN